MKVLLQFIVYKGSGFDYLGIVWDLAKTSMADASNPTLYCKWRCKSPYLQKPERYPYSFIVCVVYSTSIFFQPWCVHRSWILAVLSHIFHFWSPYLWVYFQRIITDARHDSSRAAMHPAVSANSMRYMYGGEFFFVFFCYIKAVD